MDNGACPLTLVCDDDAADDDDKYWKINGHLQAREIMPSFTSTVRIPLPSIALVSLRTRRGLDSPENPTLIREDPNSTTIVCWLVMIVRIVVVSPSPSQRNRKQGSIVVRPSCCCDTCSGQLSRRRRRSQNRELAFSSRPLQRRILSQGHHATTTPKS